MFLRIESSSGLPITRQIMDQIRSHCAGGTLCPGDRLPSVRQLAQQLAVNQNTILRVYERLTVEGLLERRHGDGTYVADRLPAGRLRAQRQLLEQEARRLAQHAAQLGVEPKEILAMIEDAFGKLARGIKAGGKADE
ncbi:MAG TPA: GntR family transcriptional regulator [Tepidisphaeraceae bacterium]|nr:GntR family transcriptional regulator [Tepidisphaeraceae bacterium]